MEHLDEILERLMNKPKEKKPKDWKDVLYDVIKDKDKCNAFNQKETKNGDIKQSDYSKIRVTSNGAFYMRSADIFNDKKESLTLLSKLSKALERYKSNQDK